MTRSFTGTRRRSARLSRSKTLCCPTVRNVSSARRTRTEPRTSTLSSEGLDESQSRGSQGPFVHRRRSGRLLRTSSISHFVSQNSDDSLLENERESRANILEDIELIPGDKSKTVESLFGDVFDTASLSKVEVEQCISVPDLRVRPLHSFGIQRAIHILQGKSIGSVTGHVCVGNFPVVVELPEEYRLHVLEYFSSKRRDPEACERFLSSRTMYHVVNGGYEHEGRWRIIDRSGYQFTGIKWRVIRIPWQDPSTLRAIAMMSSQVQKREHIVELSFLDEMVHLRRIIDDYLRETGTNVMPDKQLPRGFCKAISKIFGGGKDYANNTLRHLISISAKINMKTTLMMRSVIDEECLSIAKSLCRSSNSEGPFHVVDTRVFRKLMNSKSLRGAKKFLDGTTSDEDRKSALQRLKYIAQEKGNFKGVDHSSLDAQLERACNGREVIASFRNRILPNGEWPDPVKPLIRNILWTTKLDEAIKRNIETPNELFQPLKLAYLECAGAEGGQKIEQYEKFVADQVRNGEALGGIKSAEVSNMVSFESNSASDLTTETADGTACSDQILDDAVANPSNEESPNQESQTDPVLDEPTGEESGDINEVQVVREPEREQEKRQDILEQSEVKLYALTWELYNRSVLTEQEIFDLVISDPFQKAAAGSAIVIDSQRRANFVQFVKKVLVPGGYVFLIVPQVELSTWLTVMEEFDFKNESVFTLLKDPDSVQRLRGRSFQNLVEVAVVAQKCGRHPSRFAMDVISPYTQLPRNRYKRRAPVIDNIVPPTNRLCYPGSKTLVRTGEKSPALLWELMKTFCISGGRILDPFAGTLTTGIAAIHSGRPCILLESDENCLALGRERLKKIAQAKLEEDLANEVLSGTTEVEHEQLYQRTRSNEDNIIVQHDGLEHERSENSNIHCYVEKEDHEPAGSSGMDCPALGSTDEETNNTLCVPAHAKITDTQKSNEQSESRAQSQAGTESPEKSSEITRRTRDIECTGATGQHNLDNTFQNPTKQQSNHQYSREGTERITPIQCSSSPQKESADVLTTKTRKRNAEAANIAEPSGPTLASSRPRRARRNNRRYGR